MRDAMADPEGRFAKIVGVTASADDGNLPINTIDRDPDSRWSAEGSDPYLLLELDKEQWLDNISILFYSGNLRSNYFDLEVSSDGITYQRVLTKLPVISKIRTRRNRLLSSQLERSCEIYRSRK